MPMSRLGRVAIGILSLLWAIPLTAQSPWERQIETGLQRVTRALHEDGYREVGERRTGSLNTGESTSFTLTLESGTAYVLAGVGDEDCAALQLAVFAATGYEVAAERGATAAPMLQVTPRETGSYRIQVVMATCRMNPCSFGVAVYRR
jgi:hypothetical protein